MHRILALDARYARSRRASAAAIVALTGLVSGCHHGTAAINPLPGPSCGILQRPRITAISRATGPAAGGTVVTITGRCFTSKTEVLFGGTAAAKVKVERTDKIVATSPPGSGTVTVTVTVKTSKGRRFVSVSAEDFTYKPSFGAGSASAGAPT
jgi:hypothetical protein